MKSVTIPTSRPFTSSTLQNNIFGSRSNLFFHPCKIRNIQHHFSATSLGTLDHLISALEEKGNSRQVKQEKLGQENSQEEEREKQRQKEYEMIFAQAYEEYKKEREEADKLDIESLHQSFALLDRPLGRLKFFNLYPRRVKRWILDTNIPKGVYDVDGLWRPLASSKESSKQISEQDRIRVEQLAVEDDKFRKLPLDLRGHYRFGITPEEIEAYPDKIKRLCSFRFATDNEIKRFRMSQHIKNFGKRLGDTGDSGVQVAILTEKLISMTQHMKKHKHDYRTQRALVMLTRRRKALLQYLKRRDPQQYVRVTTKMEIPDVFYL